VVPLQVVRKLQRGGRQRKGGRHMQIAQESPATGPVASASVAGSSSTIRSAYADYKIIRRNGAVVGFEPAKISVAMTKAFLAVNGSQGAASARIRDSLSPSSSFSD
jgi:ribonucleoside-diphosphate reductase alpha chain